jgi:hypothetical protein
MSKKACKDKKLRVNAGEGRFICEKCNLYALKKKNLCKAVKVKVKS